MSHKPSCPDPYDARREGERAYEWGNSRSSNPYEDSYWNRDRACREAEDEWDRGYRQAEMRAEEAREEEAARQRAAWRRAEAEAEEDAYYASLQEAAEYEAQAQEYYASLQEQELAALEAEQATDAVDPHAAVSGKPTTRD